MLSSEAEKLPWSHEVPPHPSRAALDTARGRRRVAHLELTDNERELGCVRPIWHSYRHSACGAVSSFRYHDMAVGLAQVPDRWMHATALRPPKGAHCNHCAGNFPIGERGEFTWVDTAGHDIPVKLGT